MQYAARAVPHALVQVAAAAQTGSQLRHRAPVAFPEAPHGIAVLAVPRAPEHRELAHLIPARAHVPRLGNALDRRQDGVLVNQVKKGPEAVGLIQFAGQGAGPLQAEAGLSAWGSSYPDVC